MIVAPGCNMKKVKGRLNTFCTVTWLHTILSMPRIQLENAEKLAANCFKYNAELWGHIRKMYWQLVSAAKRLCATNWAWAASQNKTMSWVFFIIWNRCGGILVG